MFQLSCLRLRQGLISQTGSQGVGALVLLRFISKAYSEFAIPRNSYQTYIHNMCVYIYRNIYIYYICISSITVFSTFSILTSSDHIIIYYHVEFSRNGKFPPNWTKLRSCQAPGRETPPQSQATAELWTQTFRSWYPQDLFVRRKKSLAPVPLPIQALWILMGVFLWK